MNTASGGVITRLAPAFLCGTLLLSACGGDDSADPDVITTTGAASAPTSPADATPPPPEPDAGYVPPDDWQDQALTAAGDARQAVVAIGWNPPGMLRRRLEAGWLLSSTLVVTSNTVACDAQQGSDLEVRTFSGAVIRASVETITGGCNGSDPGVALIRLGSAADAPTLRLRSGDAPERGEPLLGIGHANVASALGGWLVSVGPMVETEGALLLADIGMPITLWRIDEWFGGGSNGAPLVDLNGDVVAVLCCERDWGPPVRFDDPLAELLLRRRLVLDERYYVTGLWGDALHRAIGEAG